MSHFRRDKTLRILYGMVKNLVRREQYHAQFANQPNKFNTEDTENNACEGQTQR